jgi:hypothetical protein
MKTAILLTCLSGLLLGGTGILPAQVPAQLNYQGRLRVSGTNFHGAGQFKFALVSRPMSVATRQATATATVSFGFVVAITLTDGGAGYAMPPVVSISDATGAGATAVATVSGGAVTSITVQNAGSGYSQTPTVTIAPPPPTDVVATYWSNDGTSVAGSEPAQAVPLAVDDGLFMVLLGDAALLNMTAVPPEVFMNPDVHLRIWFNDGTQGFRPLTPDQRLASVGYAAMAAQVAEGAVTGAELQSNSVTSVKIADGTILPTDLDSAAFGTTFWKTDGNAGTTAGTNFLGTTDNRPLEFKVNNTRALRLEPTGANGAVNIIGGSSNNFVGDFFGGGVVGGTIAGGGAAGADRNQLFDSFGTIGGGAGNVVGRLGLLAGNPELRFATIAGGYSNAVTSGYATIGGGQLNTVANNAAFGTICGGSHNSIPPNVEYATVSGGRNGVAWHYGQVAHASGRFASDGDAQTSVLVVRKETVNATPSELFLDGSGQRMTIPRGSAWAFDILVVGRSQESGEFNTASRAAYQIRGVIDYDGSGFQVFGKTITVLYESNAAFNADVDSIPVFSALVVRVTGLASTRMRWVASVRLAEVMFP